jgi:ATP-dependent Zn protease
LIILNPTKRNDEWNHGLGCRQRDVKEALRRLRGETGRDIVEVGNEDAKVRPRAGSYVITEREMREMYQELGKAGVNTDG